MFKRSVKIFDVFKICLFFCFLDGYSCIQCVFCLQKHYQVVEIFAFHLEHRCALKLGFDGLPFPHRRPWTKSTPFCFTPLSHHKTHLNFTELYTPQLNSSHLIFGPSAGPIFDPFGPQNRPKIGPSRLLTPYFFKNSIFHEMV